VLPLSGGVWGGPVPARCLRGAGRDGGLRRGSRRAGCTPGRWAPVRRCRLRQLRLGGGRGGLGLGDGRAPPAMPACCHGTADFVAANIAAAPTPCTPRGDQQADAGRQAAGERPHGEQHQPDEVKPDCRRRELMAKADQLAMNAPIALPGVVPRHLQHQRPLGLTRPVNPR
jgi:hypothetical protein